MHVKCLCTIIVTVGRPSAPRNFEIGTGEPGISSRLSWEAPDDSPNCCERYIRKIVSDTGEVEEEVLPLMTTTTNVFLNNSGTVTIFCQDAAGRNGTSTNSIPLPTGKQLYACSLLHQNNGFLHVVMSMYYQLC